MSAKNFPATMRLLDAAEKYPTANGTTGFLYSSDELAILLGEMSKQVAVGVHDVSHSSSDTTSLQISVYVTFSRSEYEEASL